ncbi:hypothetical protein DV736_g564, partial [Chaetothyriales sp. CBS 134916]
MATDELINFEIIENSKENIQPLREGRSAKALAAVLLPTPSGRQGKEPTLDETKTFNDAIRAEYEIELQSIEDSDDPLDIYDRYVKWTLNAYPSAQATKQSQLLPLLERATKAFLTTSHYKNDPRYLKLWLHYIRLFSDAPRETFAFLARHHIGDTLGLFYEEFAAWLESAGRWNQAAEVYEMGIQKEARPAERLLRKYNQFQQRFDARLREQNESSSPALPTVRPALATKIDPFAPAAATSENPQAAQSQAAGARTAGRSGKPKMAIFSDANDAASQPAQQPSQGWDSIGSIKERKKENIIEARPWAGETLKAGGRVGKTPRMEVFKDLSRIDDSQKQASSKSSAAALTSKTSRTERPFVCMEAIYPSEHEEFSFEELRAMHRGWSQRDWKRKRSSPPRMKEPVVLAADIESVNESFQQNLSLIDNSTQSLAGMLPPKMKPKRLKVREVKQEVQTVKTRLQSPTGPKMRKKNSAEPTMTFHSKAATNEIYDMFNRPLKNPPKEDTQSREDSDYDDTYSTAGESTGTGAATSVFGDDTLGSVHSGREDNTCSQPDSVSSWSDFTASKHVPQVKKHQKHQISSSLNLTEHMSSSQNQTQTSGLDGEFDTQAIAAIANQNFDDLDTRAIALIAGSEAGDETQETEDFKAETEDLHPQEVEITHKPRFVAIPPEDHEPTPLRLYRDPVAVEQNKLPFMTPIAEQTESSVAPSTLWKDADYFKTPSRPANSKFDSPSKLQLDELLMSSPAKELSPRSPVKRGVPPSGRTEELLISSPEKSQRDTLATAADEQPQHLAVAVEDPPPSKRQPRAAANTVTTDPIINDTQCNPCDHSVRDQILKAIQPPISSYEGFVDYSTETFGHASILKAYTDKIAKQKPCKFSPRKSQCDKSRPVPAPQLNFKGSSRIYAVKHELGKGAFAAVYLVDSSERDKDENGDTSTISERHHCTHTITTRGTLEALKSECPPETLVWEFHILRLIQSRLPPSSRTLQSLISAPECHLYGDECYLLLSYSPQGTLLDLVNHFRSANANAGKQVDGTGMDEVLVMFFTVELLRTMAALHSIGILHGDLKADNSLVRLNPAVNLTSPYSPTGSDGWSAKGLTLIDFGRGIDTTNFPSRTRFIADWDPQPEDCVEIRECKPWKWQIDFYGAAGVIHSMLFGKYLTTYRVKEAFKRYWERDTWELVFSVLLNRGGAGQLDDGVRTEHT